MRRSSCHVCVVYCGTAAFLIGSLAGKTAQAQAQPNYQQQQQRAPQPMQTQPQQGNFQPQNPSAGPINPVGSPQQQPPLQQQPVIQPQKTPPQPRVPYVLSAQEQAEINHVLLEWEKKGKGIKTFDCKFTRLDYEAPSLDPISRQLKINGPVDANAQPLPRARRSGTLRYGNPDKGLFHIEEVGIYDANTNKYQDKPDEREKWVCDGLSIYEFSGAKKQLIETKLDPALQGKAISDGPLPFLFGSEAATLAKRYWLRLVTPGDVKGQAWIEALPKYQSDAANFRAAILVLDSKDLRPQFLNLINPDGSRMMYSFSGISENSLLNGILPGFKPFTPVGWTRVVNDPNQLAAPAPIAPPRGAVGGVAPNGSVPVGNVSPANTPGNNGAASRPFGAPR